MGDAVFIFGSGLPACRQSPLTRDSAEAKGLLVEFKNKHNQKFCLSYFRCYNENTIVFKTLLDDCVVDRPSLVRHTLIE
jgi:hypothetical protein